MKESLHAYNQKEILNFHCHRVVQFLKNLPQNPPFFILFTVPLDWKCQATENVPIERSPVGGMDVGGQQYSQKGACVKQFVQESIITL